MPKIFEPSKIFMIIWKRSNPDYDSSPSGDFILQEWRVIPATYLRIIVASCSPPKDFRWTDRVNSRLSDNLGMEFPQGFSIQSSSDSPEISALSKSVIRASTIVFFRAQKILLKCSSKLLGEILPNSINLMITSLANRRIFSSSGCIVSPLQNLDNKKASALGRKA